MLLIDDSVIALSKLYSLNDSRLAQTTVKGDLIVPKSDKIMTRSRTKNSECDDFRWERGGWRYNLPINKTDPDQYTIVSAQLKIIKVLIEELISASGLQNAATAAAAAEFADEEDDDGWEDLPTTLDLGLGSTKADLMAFADGAGSFMRQRDDETQAYLTEFFVRASRENIAGFSELYTQLTDSEREKLNELAQSTQVGQ